MVGSDKRTLACLTILQYWLPRQIFYCTGSLKFQHNDDDQDFGPIWAFASMEIEEDLVKSFRGNRACLVSSF
jgi:hypothetical protein